MRRSPLEADRLRAQMIREGYPLADLTRKENDHIWRSLTQHRRPEQLQALTGMDEAQVQARLRVIRQQVKAATARR